ncbi:hypothetical protein E2C01_096794 [Portunus trituberculatus]|uniref:Uncharacterized protein n=1 Tax=Portunus trituberculatus TaxID=210409 RepID=A0A5B7K9E9_PORTR|nr:hypothetical protein [Portunus trituberculatus]
MMMREMKKRKPKKTHRNFLAEANEQPFWTLSLGNPSTLPGMWWNCPYKPTSHPTLVEPHLK